MLTSPECFTSSPTKDHMETNEFVSQYKDHRQDGSSLVLQYFNKCPRVTNANEWDWDSWDKKAYNDYPGDDNFLEGDPWSGWSS